MHNNLKALQEPYAQEIEKSYQFIDTIFKQLKEASETFEADQQKAQADVKASRQSLPPKVQARVNDSVNTSIRSVMAQIDKLRELGDALDAPLNEKTQRFLREQGFEIDDARHIDPATIPLFLRKPDVLEKHEAIGGGIENAISRGWQKAKELAPILPDNLSAIFKENRTHLEDSLQAIDSQIEELQKIREHTVELLAKIPETSVTQPQRLESHERLGNRKGR